MSTESLALQLTGLMPPDIRAGELAIISIDFEDMIADRQAIVIKQRVAVES